MLQLAHQSEVDSQPPLGQLQSHNSHHNNGNHQPSSHAPQLQGGLSTGVPPPSHGPIIETGRSPPSKNLSHVPCKFFRQGTCQAGAACPFSHSLDTQLEQAPCKYFQKGNCKFGAKCALAHILPDGRRVNYRSLMHSQQVSPQAGTPNLQQSFTHMRGGNASAAVTPPSGQNVQSFAGNPSALARLMAIQGQPSRSNSFHNGSIPGNKPLGSDMHTPDFGSPPTNADDGLSSYITPNSYRSNSGAVEPHLPQSFDPNGVSYFARHGPLAASAPTQYGADPPFSGSIPNAPSGEFLNENNTSSRAIRSLYASVYGPEQARADGISASFAVTPPGRYSGGGEPPSVSFSQVDNQNLGSLALDSNGSGDFSHLNESFAGRRHMSASYPVRQTVWEPLDYSHENYGNNFAPDSAIVEDDDDNNNNNINNNNDSQFAFEEDLVPSSLNELLTPLERQRRGSSRHDEESRNILRLGTNAGSYGHSHLTNSTSSPRRKSSTTSHAASSGMSTSPRFGALFDRQKREEALAGNGANHTNDGSHIDFLSAVGSPLKHVYGSRDSPSLDSKVEQAQQKVGDDLKIDYDEQQKTTSQKVASSDDDNSAFEDEEETQFYLEQEEESVSKNGSKVSYSQNHLSERMSSLFLGA